MMINDIIKNYHHSIWRHLYVYLPAVFLMIMLAGCQKKSNYLYLTESSSEKINFGLKQIGTALAEQGIAYGMNRSGEADISWKIQISGDSLIQEGFSIKVEDGNITIIGADEAGIMYGALELAEQIRLYGLGGVRETTKNPHMELRGVKFNIPLDVRTPSYSDASDAAQHNIPNMWDFTFWQEYIDNLARHRYNYISLWNLHPFPSLVKVADYPDIALNDVQRSTNSWDEYYHLHGTGLDDPKILQNPEIVKEITIDDKIVFWRKVMEYAKGRNIKFFMITWNVFINGTDGKYGITDDIDNSITRDYFRKSIKELFVTYPDLAGIGLTTGENMHGATFEEKEDWAFDTYARAVLELAKEMPKRQFTFIHRQHQTGARDIIQKFQPLIAQNNLEFLFSFKYAKAHVYSTVTQGFHEEFVKDIGDLKTIWGLRNDDIYHFRWGAPDFVRQFVNNMPTDVMKGMYYGSDQWIWGREFLSKDSLINLETLEIEKHWYQWMLWGRLTYDPLLGNDRIRDILQHKFSEIYASDLFDAWQHASMIYPITTGFHWGASDFQWYIEGCKSRPAQANNETGFHDVNRFISLPPHPKSGCQSIPEFVQMVMAEKDTTLKSPLAVSSMLHEQADRALEILLELKPVENDELNATLADIRTMSYLGKYYAHKISGATYLALYRATKDKESQQVAVKELVDALKYWELYVQATLQQYINPLWTNRVGRIDFKETTKWVKDDITIAKE